MDETMRARIKGMVKRCEELASMAITLKASLEALLVSLDSADQKNQAIVEEFSMPNPNALNKGPLAWLLRKLEEEERKGYMEVWHAIQGDTVRFTIKLKPEATPEDRKKLNRWFVWVRKALQEGRQK
jgi:hypothetical protein